MGRLIAVSSHFHHFCSCFHQVEGLEFVDLTNHFLLVPGAVFFMGRQLQSFVSCCVVQDLKICSENNIAGKTRDMPITDQQPQGQKPPEVITLFQFQTHQAWLLENTCTCDTAVILRTNLAWHRRQLFATTNTKTKLPVSAAVRSQRQQAHSCPTPSQKTQSTTARLFSSSLSLSIKSISTSHTHLFPPVQ